MNWEVVIGKIFELPPGRFLFVTAVLVLVAFVAICGYESYTTSFELAREDKSIQLLEKLQQLEQNGILSGSERLKKIYDERVDLLFIKTKESRQIAWWTKGIVLSWPWMGLVVISSCTWLQGQKYAPTVFITSLVFAVPAFWLGTELTSFWWPWFHILISVIPVFVLVIILKTRVTNEVKGS